MATKVPVLVHLNPLQLEQLGKLTAISGAPRAALVRMALDAFLATALPEPPPAAATPELSPAAIIALAQIAGLR